jgi:hypothetical protein
MDRPGRIVLVLAVVAAALAATAQAPARPACTAGVHSNSGVTYRTFCGPARATLHLGGKTLTFTGGSCDSTSGTFTINIGTITLGSGKPKFRYFGITVFTDHDGTFQNQAVAWQLPNGQRGALFRATVKLKNGRKKGTFTGSALTGGGTGSGTFSCR